MAARRCEHVLEDHARPVLSLAISNNRLYSGSYDFTIKVRRAALCCLVLNLLHAAALGSLRCGTRAIHGAMRPAPRITPRAHLAPLSIAYDPQLLPAWWRSARVSVWKYRFVFTLFEAVRNCCLRFGT